MFERSEVVFKILCVGLGAVVLWQGVRAIQRSDPLAGASIPALPSLPSDTNLVAKGTNALKSEGGGRKAEGGDTNLLAKGTNAPKAEGRGLKAEGGDTNLLAKGTNALKAEGRGLKAEGGDTNLLAKGTNAPKAEGRGPKAEGGGTNLVAKGTNAAVPPAGNARPNPGARPDMARGRMNAGPFPGMPGKGPPLPPAVQGRLDRIIESELLAPVMHPQPVALLGIVGVDALMQAPNGQSGMIKEGEEMGGIKLLKLGINRALIEEAGEKKELTLFSGLGSESLLSKQTNSP